MANCRSIACNPSVANSGSLLRCLSSRRRRVPITSELMKSWKAPFRNGSLEAWPGHHPEEHYEWLPPETTFEARLGVEGPIYGRSSRLVEWKVSPGTFRLLNGAQLAQRINEPQTFPMFLSEFFELIKCGAPLERYGKLHGIFGFVKQGQNYSIKYLGEPELVQLMPRFNHPPPYNTGLIVDEESGRGVLEARKPIYGM